MDKLSFTFLVMAGPLGSEPSLPHLLFISVIHCFIRLGGNELPPYKSSKIVNSGPVREGSLPPMPNAEPMANFNTYMICQAKRVSRDE